jgi:hypothetical protein
VVSGKGFAAPGAVQALISYIRLQRVRNFHDAPLRQW